MEFPPPAPDPNLVTDRKIYPPATPGGHPGARTRFAGFPGCRRPPGRARKAQTRIDTADDGAPVTAARHVPLLPSRYHLDRHPPPRQKTDFATDPPTVTAGAISHARPREPVYRLPPPIARTLVTRPGSAANQKACFQPALASSSTSVGSSGECVCVDFTLPKFVQIGQGNPSLPWLLDRPATPRSTGYAPFQSD